MSEPAHSIERRDDRHAAIEAILGTGDIRQMVEAAKANVAVAVAIARDRGFVTDYELKDRNGDVIGQRAFFHLATWQLLAQSWGLTAFTDGEPREVKPGTWQASAVAQTIEDGRVVGRAVALCARSEPGKKYKGDHDLAATAQSRAQRNAIRSCLGSLLIAAGVDIADPDAPATAEQKGLLHQLARELELDADAAHEIAGVASFSDLTREQAAELIDAWTRQRDEASAPDLPVELGAEPGGGASEDRHGASAPPGTQSSPEDAGEGIPPVGPSGEDPFADEPAPPEQWERAQALGVTGARALKRARERHRDHDPLFPEIVTRASAITYRQLQALCAEASA
jgi:hypothetical protein